MRGMDVEKGDLVGARRIVGAGGIDGIARIAQVDEIHALDHTAIGDIETGDDTGLEHGLLMARIPADGKGGEPAERPRPGAVSQACRSIAPGEWHSTASPARSTKQPRPAGWGGAR
ncbi:hypothetical protein GCM10011415_10940 [Salipiger pallidus]|uniref:Uncharacterized protein n=1 Tax=Salipiger pallidus TaxID=1775170 RepID=A0A8J2ZI44_9RHOB|nr:hypothetical protein GCM10011415_10940 [Salipiger pallidus]